MSEMLTRAVAAIEKRVGGTDAEYARDVLLAALDPEDEALVAAVGDALVEPYEKWNKGDVPYDVEKEALARAALETLKRLAQGEK